MDPRELSDNERRLAVPAEKRTGIILLIKQVLLLDTLEEATSFFVALRGRAEGRIDLMFGELRGLANTAKIVQAGAKVGIEDVESQAVDFANVLASIADPLMPICEKCHRYAVDVEGGVITVINGVRCPFSGCGGLILQPKQEKPFQSWVTPQERAPAVTHYREGHLALPERNDVILTEAGQGLYEISSLVRQALEQEDMKTEEGDINVAQFLAFLAHDRSTSSRFRGKDEVLRSLGNPSMFGAYDLTSVRAIVRQAKGWTGPSKPNPSIQPVHGGSERPLNLSRQDHVQIRKALRIACSGSPQFKMMAQDIELDCGRLSFQNGDEIIAADIVEEAGKQGDAVMRSLLKVIMERAPVTASVLRPLLS